MKNDFEEVLRASYHELVDEIRATTDTKKALASLYARAAADASPVAVEDPPTEESPGLPEFVTAIGDGDQAELESICMTIAKVIDVVSPGPDDDPLWRDSRASTFYFTNVAQLLSHLMAGLARREITRADADRMLRLAAHNLGEGTHLMAGEQQRAKRRRIRRGLRDLLDELIAIRDVVADLHPRVMRLFQDSDESAPLVPVPHGPA